MTDFLDALREDWELVVVALIIVLVGVLLAWSLGMVGEAA